MTTLLLRHAEPDWDLVSVRSWPGLANDLAPLSARGRTQAVEAAEALAGAGVTTVVSSPMTRALETAAVVSRRLELGIQIHLDLHEWLADSSFQWRTFADVLAAYEEMLAGGGEWPPGKERPWEQLSSVRTRATAALKSLGPVTGTRLVVCHEVVIQALTGISGTPHATIREWHDSS